MLYCTGCLKNVQRLIRCSKIRSNLGLRDEITHLLRSLINFRHQTFVDPTNAHRAKGVLEVQDYANAETRGF